MNPLDGRRCGPESAISKGRCYPAGKVGCFSTLSIQKSGFVLIIGRPRERALLCKIGESFGQSIQRSTNKLHIGGRLEIENKKRMTREGVYFTVKLFLSGDPAAETLYPSEESLGHIVGPLDDQVPVIRF